VAGNNRNQITTKGYEEKQHLQPQRAQRNTEEIRKSIAKAKERAGGNTGRHEERRGRVGEWKKMKIFAKKQHSHG